MKITVSVRDILALNSFIDVYVIAGENGLANVVDNVFFMEVPDIYKYVDPHGLLLTTLYPIANNEEAIRSFIPNLVEKNVSCLAIKLGRYVDELPPIMIGQANEYKIPILILPNNANLSKLSNDILELFLDKKTSILEYRDKIHSRLMALLLEGADLQKLVSTVSGLFQVPVLLVDQYFRIQTTSLREGEEVKITQQEDAESYITVSENRIGVQLGGREFDSGQIVLQPIVASSENLGYLIALCEEKSIHSDLIIGLEQASMLCAFLFQREKAIQQNERIYLDSFIRDVLNGKFSHQHEAVQKAKVFEWELTFPLVAVTIEVLDKNDARKREIYSELLFHGMVEQFIRQELNLSPRSFKVVYHDEALLCLISAAGGSDAEEGLSRVCAGITDYYRKHFALGFGISNTVDKFTKLLDGKEEAKLALDISKRLHGAKPFIAFYNQIGIYKLLHQITDRQVLNTYVEERLGLLLKSSSKDTDLLETLLCILKNNFNLQKTAKELFIHYNTLRYRIDKLKECGVDIANGLELAEMAVAYQIHQYLLITKK